MARSSSFHAAASEQAPPSRGGLWVPSPSGACPHAGLSQANDERLPILFPVDDVFPPVPAIHHVVDGAFVFTSRLSRHARLLPQNSSCVNNEDRPRTDPFIGHHDLACLLVETVQSGAAVSFLAPLAIEHAEEWWRKTMASAAASSIFLVARDDIRIVGTVQAHPSLGAQLRGQVRAEVPIRQAQGPEPVDGQLRHEAGKSVSGAPRRRKD